MSLLSISGVSVDYSGIHALRNVTLSIAEKSLVTVIGANGAGKSTLLKSICGLVRKRSGTVVFDGEDVSTLQPYELIDRGLVLCPEGRKLFPEMTVFENLKMGAYRVGREEFRRQLDMIYDVFPKVTERRNQVAASLSGGEQQMVAIARALVSKPRVLLLDEPTLGLAPKMIAEVGRLATRINQQGVTVVLVEQNAKLALSVSDYGYVMETGSIVMEDASNVLLNSEEVASIYLGGDRREKIGEGETPMNGAYSVL